MALAKLQGRSHCADEWRQVDGLWYLCDKIYIPNILDLWQQIAKQHHDSKITGHARCWKMLELILWNYCGLHMLWFVDEYCKACNLCLWTKVQCHKPIGELHPLLVSENQWDVISVNFITKLPESHGYNAVMVVVNLTGSVAISYPPIPQWLHLDLCGFTCSRCGKLHGRPLSVLSDHIPQFVS